MTKKSLGVAVMAVGTVLAMGVAMARPPHGVALFHDHTRGVAVGSGVVTITPGTYAYAGSYSLQPGSAAGWRAQPGLSGLSVTVGTLRVVQAKGCATREYKPGEVAVLPAGTLRVGNAADEPAAFVGYFDNLGAGAAKPLADGAEAKTPKGCSVGGAYRAASSRLSAVDIARGTFKPVPAHAGQHGEFEAERLELPAGGDVALMTASIAPGTSTGRYRHSPGRAILTKGSYDTWAATDTGCAKVEETHAGEAASHAHHDQHLTVFSDEPAEALLFYWGMGNSDPVPGPVGGFATFVEANDFTVMPPNGCTTF